MIFLDPRFWLAAIGALALAFFAGDWKGQHDASKKHDLEMARANFKTFEKNAEATKKLTDNIDAITAQSAKEKQDAQAENDKLRAALRTGSKRLSVAVNSCNPTRNPSTGITETRAELLPATAADIFDIGADADTAVRDLNECVDKYNKVRERSR